MGFNIWAQAFFNLPSQSDREKAPVAE